MLTKKKEQPDASFKIAVLISGNGSTLSNLLKKIFYRKLKANISIVISSRKNALGIKIAKDWNIPYKIVPYLKYKKNLEKYSDEITKILQSYKVDLVVLGGFLSPYFVPKVFENKVINIHPSLIPRFSGKGYYGRKVHEAVKKSGVKKTGCTIHYVDNKYDHGPIITQKKCSISSNDNVFDIEKKVKNLEQKLYPKIIQKKFIIKNNYKFFLNSSKYLNNLKYNIKYTILILIIAIFI